MRNRYRPNKKSSFSSGGKKPYRGGNSRRRSGGGGGRGGRYQSNGIRHEQYIAEAIPTKDESLYVESATFADFDLDPRVMQNINAKGYVHPTKIQDLAIPQILAGHDILGMASTGSGKTAAFLLPMITKTLSSYDERCLIVVPTRELANQIRQEFKDFSKGTKLFDAIIMGGTGYNSQLRALRQRPQFVIATPGRLLDIHKMGKIDLRSFNNIILDEVDQMLDMGFINDIEYIVANLANERQCLFFSATMSYKSESIARKFVRNPQRIEIATQKAATNVEQKIVKYKFVGEKINKLHDLLIEEEFDKVLIFSRTRRGADSLAKELYNRGHKSGVIHGEKSLGQRNRVIAQFKQSHIDILVATDVAARGIDIQDISHVINFDEPATYEDYIHRIGRTGRIGKKGVALTFVR